ncbi:MAG: hypothetical protein QOG45_1367 [Chloroflexota bacterium]|nr:hypothetical protein [Chloroflexota bacterium]
MGSERWRRALAAVPLALGLLAAGPAAATAAAEPWWVPVGLRGEAVSAVVPAGHGLLATAGGRPRCLPLPGSSAPPVCERPAGGAGGATPGGAPGWALRGGHVVRLGAGAAVVDPGSPDLGASARLLVTTAALPGVVVAVAADGTVWRRSPAGGWGRSLLLLPRSLLAGPPAVTGLAAFETSPVTSAVYLATDGYAVLITTDGGDDWVRAAPGLPVGVLAIATDAASRAVYAGTRDGLWVHRLQRIPGPPAYRHPALLARWLGIAALAGLTTLVALAALAWAARSPAASSRSG